MPGIPTPLVVWHFSDGKPGHDNQVRGLLRALNVRSPLHIHRLDTPVPGVRNTLRTLADWLCRRCPAGRHLPDPELIVGAGHAAHLAMLAARRARGGRVVVFMKPSLPLACFDLCIVPEHDPVRARANVLITRGALNTVEPAPHKLERHGLILVGGPSKHYRWSDRAMLERIETIARQDLNWSWTVAGSRRTPDSMEHALLELRAPNVTYVAARDTGSEWLPFRLAEAPRVWVSEDSVSMVYEALSAGAAVGLLEVPTAHWHRLYRLMRELIRDGWVTAFEDWRQGAALRAPPVAFNEARRCADWIARHWLAVARP